VVYFFKGATLLSLEGWNVEDHTFNVRRFFKLTVLYAGFAFIVTLIREALKDMEDSIGDAQFNCKTMPIVWGIPATKVFTGVWIIVCCSTLLIVQVYAWQIGWWFSAVYSIVFMIIPLIFLLKKLRTASLPKDYHQLSTQLKWIMLAGILSMIFFKILP
jgi:4-hydroxybenzoate polyprenyltransferase